MESNPDWVPALRRGEQLNCWGCIDRNLPKPLPEGRGQRAIRPRFWFSAANCRKKSGHFRVDLTFHFPNQQVLANRVSTTRTFPGANGKGWRARVSRSIRHRFLLLEAHVNPPPSTAAKNSRAQHLYINKTAASSEILLDNDSKSNRWIKKQNKTKN